MARSKAADKSVRATRSLLWIVHMGIKMVIGGIELLFSCFMGMGLRRVWLKNASEWNSFSIMGEC
jgi:hypothetical protein